MFSVPLVRQVTLPGRYPAHCPSEFGLSSPSGTSRQRAAVSGGGDRLADCDGTIVSGFSLQSPVSGPDYTQRVDAEPLLAEVARKMHELSFEAVLIGNAAAALQGAPVTTIDFDYMFRKTPRNMVKLKRLARALRATILRPYYPISDLFRVSRDEDSLQVDFMATIHGVRSFAGLRDRAMQIDVAGAPLLVASLRDIIKSKRAAKRPRDLAVIDILEAALAQGAQTKTTARSARPRK